MSTSTVNPLNTQMARSVARAFGVENLSELKTQKRGRQGYLVRYYKDTLEDKTPWSFELVTQNGVVVASSDLLYSSRANARRSVNRLFNGAVTQEVTVEV